MSPVERNDPKLRDLELDDSGAGPPDDVVEQVEEELDAGLEPSEEELDEALDEEVRRVRGRWRSTRPSSRRPRRLTSVTPARSRGLYNGETSFDFVGRKKWWFLISGIIIVVGMLSLGFRGLNLGIDFKGRPRTPTSR